MIFGPDKLRPGLCFLVSIACRTFRWSLLSGFQRLSDFQICFYCLWFLLFYFGLPCSPIITYVCPQAWASAKISAFRKSVSECQQDVRQIKKTDQNTNR